MPEPANGTAVTAAILRESPLSRFELPRRAAGAPGAAGVIARERAFLGHLNLRGDADDPRFAAAVGSALGVALPVAPNTVAEAPDAGLVVCWLGPDEWLVVCAGERGASIEGALRAALVGARSAVTDLSGGQTVIALRGAAVREVLAKGCPLDLHPRAFDAGRCAQSLLAKAPILIRQVDREPSFEVVVRRSFAGYLWTWLDDAAAEYGFAVMP